MHILLNSKIRFVLLAILLNSTFLFSQQKTVKGFVKSSEDGETIPFASVVVKGTANGVATDVSGNYSISGVKNDDILVFSFVGFANQEIKVGEKTVINVTLLKTVQVIDAVEVTALGIKRQKRAIGYSTQKIEAKLLEKSSEPNILSGMSGRAAGVSISNSNGIEGGSTRIVIRGNNNISGRNQPLIVIDGVQMENTPGLTNIGRGQDWGSPINNINPQDIEDINILKGGAASALYGSRGANGVIEITTKRGEEQQGIGISYNMNYKITYPYRFREVQNKYGHGGPISFSPPTFPTNATGDTLLYPGIYGTDNLLMPDGSISSSAAEFGYYGSSVSWGPEMKGQQVKWWDGKMRSYSPQPDNLKMFFNNGHNVSHNIAGSGGGKNGSMRVSYTNTKNTPIVGNSFYKQNTLNLGADLKLSKRLRVLVSSSYIDYNRLNTPILGEDPNSFSKGSLYCWPRSYQGIEMDNYELEDGTRNPLSGYPFYYINPYVYWNYNNNNTNLDRNRFLTSVSVVYKINNWLDFSARSGRDFNMSQFQTKHKPTDLIGVTDGYYANSLQKDKSDNMDFLFTFYKDSLLGPNFNAKFSVGASQWNQDNYYIGGNSGTNWDYPNMYTFFNYSPYEFDGNELINTGDIVDSLLTKERIYKRRTNSTYSFLDLEYKNYLFLQLTGRNDWSSTLPANNNSYFYPSVSVSFLPLSAFEGMKTKWMNFWKIRAGASQTATDDLPYQTEFYYNTGLFGGSQTSGFPSTIPPYALKPQRVNSYEIGSAFGFFENKIDLDFTYYYAYSFDQIIQSPLPASSGADFIKINDGVVTNRGIELVLNATPIAKKNLIVSTGINYARNKNIVKSLGDYADMLMMAEIWGLNGPAMALREGDEFGTIYGYDYVYHANGKPIVNEDGTKYLVTENRVPIGNASPKFVAGWHTTVKYKNISFGTLIDCKWGGDIYAGSYVIGLQTGQSPETLLERDGGGLAYTDPEGNTNNIGVILDGVYEDGTVNDKVVHYYYKYMPNAGGWGHFLSTPGIVENT
ncbi:MAG: SusC/RagA family TonB-linked outer membrane protein, partial [Bacteroidales bacterium]|nr:SusC/RagA family TonB-linked outer membrane protein [Bacteroidales bacterium]